MQDKNIMSIIEGKFYIKELQGDIGTDFLMVIPYNVYRLNTIIEVRVGAFYGRFNGASNLKTFNYLGSIKVSDIELDKLPIEISVNDISNELKKLYEEKYKNEVETKQLFASYPKLFEEPSKWEENSIVNSTPYYSYFGDFFREVENGIQQKTLKEFFEKCRKRYDNLMENI